MVFLNYAKVVSVPRISAISRALINEGYRKGSASDSDNSVHPTEETGASRKAS